MKLTPDAGDAQLLSFGQPVVAIDDIDLAISWVFPNIDDALEVGAPLIDAFQGVAFLLALVD